MESKSFFEALLLNKHCTARLHREERRLEQQQRVMYNRVWREKELLMDDYIHINVRTPSPQKVDSSPVPSLQRRARSSSSAELRKRKMSLFEPRQNKSPPAVNPSAKQTPSVPELQTSDVQPLPAMQTNGSGSRGHGSGESKVLPKTVSELPAASGDQQFRTGRDAVDATPHESTSMVHGAKQRTAGKKCTSRNGVTHGKTLEHSFGNGKTDLNGKEGARQRSSSVDDMNRSLLLQGDTEPWKPAVWNTAREERAVSNGSSPPAPPQTTPTSSRSSSSSSPGRGKDASSGAVYSPRKSRTPRHQQKTDKGNSGRKAGLSVFDTTQRKSQDRALDPAFLVSHSAWEDCYRSAEQDQNSHNSSGTQTAWGEVLNGGTHQLQHLHIADREEDQFTAKVRQVYTDESKSDIKREFHPTRVKKMGQRDTEDSMTDLQPEFHLEGVKMEHTTTGEPKTDFKHGFHRDAMKTGHGTTDESRTDANQDFQPDPVKVSPRRLPRKKAHVRQMTLDPKLILPLSAKRYRCKKQATIIPVIAVQGRQATLYPNAEAKVGRVVTLDRRVRGWMERSTSILFSLENMHSTSPPLTLPSTPVTSHVTSPRDDADPLPVSDHVTAAMATNQSRDAAVATVQSRDSHVTPQEEIPSATPSQQKSAQTSLQRQRADPTMSSSATALHGSRLRSHTLPSTAGDDDSSSDVVLVPQTIHKDPDSPLVKGKQAKADKRNPRVQLMQRQQSRRMTPSRSSFGGYGRLQRVQP